MKALLTALAEEINIYYIFIIHLYNTDEDDEEDKDEALNEAEVAENDLLNM